MKKNQSIAVVACLLVIGVSLGAFSRSAEAKPKIGILGLQPIDETGGADPQLNNAAKLMTNLLRQIAQQRKPLKFDIQTKAFEDFLAVKILYDCSDESPDCLAEIGKQLGVDVLLYGKIERIPGKGYEVRIYLFDVSRKAGDGRSEEIVPGRAIGEPEEARKWAIVLWDEVLGRRETGSLKIESNAMDGRIYIDNKRVGRIVEGEGRVPMVEAGDRAVRVEASKGSAEQTVTVTKGEEASVEINVGATIGDGDGDDDDDDDDDGGGSGGDSRVGWKIGFGVSLVATGALAGLGYYTRVTKVDEKTKEQGAFPGPDGGCNGDFNSGDFDKYEDLCDQGKKLVYLGNGLFVGAGVAAIATGFFAYKAFIASRRSSSERNVAGEAKRKEPTARFLPIGPGDVGASLEITF